VLVKGTFYLLVTLDTPEEPPNEARTVFWCVDLGIVMSRDSVVSKEFLCQQDGDDATTSLCCL